MTNLGAPNLTLYSREVTLTVTAASCRTSDSLELVTFYNAMGGTGWTDNSNWLTGTLDTWNGVTLDGNGCLIILSLGNNNLVGSLYDFNFTNLTRLSVSSNQISGSIYDFVDMPEIRTLNLSNNLLTGSIPDFTGLPQLQNLYLTGNSLSSSIPDFANIPLLQNFWAFNNQLSGNIPDFSSLPALEVLRTGANQLSGSIPDFSNLPNLLELRIYENQFTGNVPNFSAIPSLNYLDLNDNSLDGAIPNFSNLSSLDKLILNDNLFSGNLPDFNQLTSLTILDVSNNELFGEFPLLSALVGLINLRLSGNYFSGTLPNFSMPDLTHLYVFFNRFDGMVQLTGLPSLSNFILHSNVLTFEPILLNVGVASSQYYYDPQDSIGITQTQNLSTGNLFTIDLGIDDGIVTNVYAWFKDGTLVFVDDSNTFTIASVTPADAGVYTCEVINSGAPDLTLYSREVTLRILTCRETDSLELVTFYNTMGGASWISNSNWLTGPLDTWYGVTMSVNDCVSQLVLSSNNLVGVLPDISLSELTTLNLLSNQVSGSIPNFTGIPNLLFLTLGGNNLSGSIPNFSNIPQLRNLYLITNQLTGPIPDFSGIPLLQSMSLAGNNLTGTIPDFSNLPMLNFLWLEQNQLSGSIPDFSNNTNLRDLWIADNQFSDISIFTNLPALGIGLFKIENNQLTFDDILANILVPNQTYAPQDTIGIAETQNVVEGASFTIDLDIDDGLEGQIDSNRYSWFKDNASYSNININVFTIPNITIADAGVYRCEVTNPTAPDLTLYSREVILAVTAGNLQNDR